MAVLNWICFILICMDVVAYVMGKTTEMNNASSKFAFIIGIMIGVAARVYVLYNAATYWLLT